MEDLQDQSNYSVLNGSKQTNGSIKIKVPTDINYDRQRDRSTIVVRDNEMKTKAFIGPLGAPGAEKNRTMEDWWVMLKPIEAIATAIEVGAISGPKKGVTRRKISETLQGQGITHAFLRVRDAHSVNEMVSVCFFMTNCLKLKNFPDVVVSVLPHFDRASPMHQSTSVQFLNSATQEFLVIFENLDGNSSVEFFNEYYQVFNIGKPLLLQYSDSHSYANVSNKFIRLVTLIPHQVHMGVPHDLVTTVTFHPSRNSPHRVLTSFGIKNLCDTLTVYLIEKLENFPELKAIIPLQCIWVTFSNSPKWQENVIRGSSRGKGKGRRYGGKGSGAGARKGSGKGKGSGGTNSNTSRSFRFKKQKSPIVEKTPVFALMAVPSGPVIQLVSAVLHDRMEITVTPDTLPFYQGIFGQKLNLVVSTHENSFRSLNQTLPEAVAEKTENFRCLMGVPYSQFGEPEHTLFIEHARVLLPWLQQKISIHEILEEYGQQEPPIVLLSHTSDPADSSSNELAKKIFNEGVEKWMTHNPMCDPLGDLITPGSPYSYSVCVIFATSEDARRAQVLAYHQVQRGLLGEFGKITSLQPSNSFIDENMYSMYEYYHDTGLKNVKGEFLPCQTEHEHSTVFWELLKDGSREHWSLMGDNLPCDLQTGASPLDLRSMKLFISEHESSEESQENQEEVSDDLELPWLQSIIQPAKLKGAPAKSGKDRKAEAASEAKRIKEQKKAHKAVVDKQQDGWRKEFAQRQLTDSSKKRIAAQVQQALVTEKEAHMKKLQFEQEQEFVAKALALANAQTLSANSSATEGTKPKKGVIRKIKTKVKKSVSGGTGSGNGAEMIPPTPNLGSTANGTPATVQIHSVDSGDDQEIVDAGPDDDDLINRVEEKSDSLNQSIDLESLVGIGGESNKSDELNQSLDMITSVEGEADSQSDKDSPNENEGEPDEMDLEREKRKKVDTPVKTAPTANRSSKRNRSSSKNKNKNNKVSHTQNFTLLLPFSDTLLASSNLEAL